jgi:prepilin-type N-terminal cleavage/methylation domain-containing protein
MASPKTSTRNRGFTLIEILTVIGLLAIMVGFGLAFSMDAYRGYNFRNERDTVINLLQKARSQAVSNIDQQPHGLHVDANQYVLFEGSPYISTDPKNITIPSTASISHNIVSDILFNQLDGSITTPPAALVISDASHTSSVTVNNEGQIAWTN